MKLPASAVSVAVAVVTALLTTSATIALTNESDVDHSTALAFYHRHYADVFDPVAVHPTGRFKEPNRLAEGFRHVITNGVFALEDGRLTGARGGRALRL